MFNKIVDWSVTNRLLVVIALVVAVASASFIIPSLNLDAFPDVTNVQVSVNTEVPGLAAEEVEQLVTFPIESVMYSLPDVEEVRSISKTGLSVITVVFREGTDIYFARQLVFERLQAARELIPEGVGIPEIGPNTSGLGQVYQYVLLATPESGYDIISLRSLNDWVVKLLLMPVDGVTDVLSFGGEVRQYQVNVNPDRLLAFSLTLNDVVAAIRADNRNEGGWYLDRGQEQLVVRGVGWLPSEEEGLVAIGQIPVKEEDGIVVRVRDIAKVGYGGEIRQGAVTMVRRDGENIESLGEVVSGIVLKRLGANTKATIDGITERIPLINQALPEGVTFEPFYDQADLVTQAVDTVTEALILAFIFIIIVLLLFLMNLRAAILVLISIPLSVGMALTVMAYFGLSANLMSLGGLAVAIGMMVDGAVVLVENIFKHLSRPGSEHDRYIGENIPQDDAEPYGVSSNLGSTALRIQEASREVAKPVFFAVVIILVVFAPLFTLEGVEGKLFQPMAISIMIAMLAALLVALIVVPALASFVFRSGIKQRPSPIVVPLEKLYRLLLERAMHHKVLVVGTAGFLLVLSLFLVPRLGTEFVPELEEGTINLRVTLAPSANIDTSLSVARKLELQLLEFPEVIYALSRVGRSEIGGDPEPVNNVEIFMGLLPVSEWTSASNRFELQALMQEKLEVHPGLLFNFSQPIATRVDELLSGIRAELAIKLFGPDLDILVEKGREIEAIVRETPGTQDVALEQVEGEAQLVIRPKRAELSRFGLAVGDVMSVIRNGIGGESAGQIINGNERYDIYVRLEQQSRNSVDAISALRLQASNGSWVRLSDVATVEIESGPPQIRRDDVQRRVVIQSNVQGRDMGSVVADIASAIESEIELPPGYSVVYGGQFENQQRAQQRLLIVVPISIGLIALLLYFAFASIGQALLILVNLPLAMIGGIVALYISGQYLSVPGSIGFITLFGVAVLNGVVMVESINQRLLGGESSLEKAAFEGALSRLRPVLMTAITSALGLIPLLLSDGIGSEIQRPLATVIVGGLTTATFLTLFVLPALYPFFSRRKFESGQM